MRELNKTKTFLQQDMIGRQVEAKLSHLLPTFKPASQNNSQAFLPIQIPLPQSRFYSSSFVSRKCEQYGAWCTSNRFEFRSTRNLAMSTNATTGATSSAQNRLIDALLQEVEGSNRGAESSKSERENVINIIEQLLASSGPPPTLTDPRLFDCFSVLYSVTPQSSQQKSPAVGGFLRSPLGRFVFRTTGLYQHLILPNIAVNLVCFRFLGLIDGMVSLYGTVSPVGSESRYLLVTFESPRARIGPAVFQYGPVSSVSLDFCYVDDRIRIGRGKFGTYIVFLRRPSPDAWPEADAWKDFLEVKPWPAFISPLILLSVVMVSFRSPLIIRIVLISFAIVVARVFIR